MIPGGVIDTHLHLWDLGKHRYPWLDDPGCEQLRTNYLPENFRQDAVGVDVTGTVHVQAEMDHAVDPVAETAWLSSLTEPGAGSRAIPTACVGYADLRAPGLDAVLDRHADYAIFRGIRQEAWFDQNSTRADVPRYDLVADPAWERGLRRLAARRLLFELLVRPHQLARAAEIFAAIPELPVVLEHAGLPPADGWDARAQWRAGLQAFAARVPNSVLKISALRSVCQSWQPDRLRSIVREAVDVFGPTRCVLGSNFPVDKPAVAYPALWRTFEDMTSHLSGGERADIFRNNAARIYRIDVSAPTGGPEPA